ncbi:MAG: tRNA (N(6)-L-threonylcarbamoyladenosine(37)-C(2))-methylthiotransferase MtaB [Fimbriimonadaceae bacterium]
MPKAAFTTLGCKVNQYETQKILESFAQGGFEIVPFESKADVYVINTCSVTSIAESKSRYTIRRATRLNPEAKVVVTGCASQFSLNRGESVEFADLVVPNPQKLETYKLFRQSFPTLVEAVGPTQDLVKLSHNGRTRATLKIQDGCNVMCSYCSIPFTRPGMVSRPAKEVLQEAQAMVAGGYKEIILTGVLIGAYRDGLTDFEGLLELLQRNLADVRLRISSIEMRQVTPRLIELMQAQSAVKIVPHLHIPLQAGDDAVLAAMNRPYRQADYLALCANLKRAIPEISITTDIMVGFPTETDECFESTVRVCEEVGFLKIHAFRFSPRDGTPANQYGDPIEVQEKNRRATVLNAISARTATAHSRRFLGDTMRVLVEGKDRPDGVLEGLTDNYLTVRFAGDPSLRRSFVMVNLQEETNGILTGELAPATPRIALSLAT